MEKIEKILLVAVLGVALLIVGVMAALPPEVGAEDGEKIGGGESPIAKPDDAGSLGGRGGTDTIYDSMRDNPTVGPNGVPRGPNLRPLEDGPLPQLAPEAGTHAGPSVASSGGEARPLTPAVPPGPAGGSGVGGDERAASGEPKVRGELEDPKAAIAYTEFTRHPLYFDYVIYRVRRNDTLSHIATSYCRGGLAAIDAIIKVNEKLAGDPTRLDEGEEIILPSAIVLSKAEIEQRRAARLAADAAKRGGASTKETSMETSRQASNDRASSSGGTAPVRGTQAYTVQPGDSLWSIAAAKVGTKDAMKFIDSIRKLNPQLRGDLLHPGKPISLPVNATNN